MYTYVQHTITTIFAITACCKGHAIPCANRGQPNHRLNGGANVGTSYQSQQKQPRPHGGLANHKSSAPTISGKAGGRRKPTIGAKNGRKTRAHDCTRVSEQHGTFPCFRFIFLSPTVQSVYGFHLTAAVILLQNYREPVS